MKASKEIKKEKYETPNSVSIEIDYESIICSSPNEISEEKYETPNSVSIEIDYESIICSSPNEISGSGDDFIEGTSHGGGTSVWD